VFSTLSSQADDKSHWRWALRHVAKAAGVSTATVSRAVNTQELRHSIATLWEIRTFPRSPSCLSQITGRWQMIRELASLSTRAIVVICQRVCADRSIASGIVLVDIRPELQSVCGLRNCLAGSRECTQQISGTVTLIFPIVIS
jgi:hypothetical protein